MENIFKNLFNIYILNYHRHYTTISHVKRLCDSRTEMENMQISKNNSITIQQAKKTIIIVRQKRIESIKYKKRGNQKIVLPYILFYVNCLRRFLRSSTLSAAICSIRTLFRTVSPAEVRISLMRFCRLFSAIRPSLLKKIINLE